MKSFLNLCLLFYWLGTPVTVPLYAEQEAKIYPKEIQATISSHGNQESEASSPSPISFDEKQLEEYKEQPAFNYAPDVSDTWWNRFKSYLNLQWNRLMTWIFGDLPTGGVLLFLLQILPYIILFTIFIFLLWMFNRMNPGQILLTEKSQNQVIFDEEEEIVQNRNIPEMIKQALAAKDYKSAIRYQYLLVLQILNQQEIINYQPAKTNEEYAREITSDALRSAFRRLSRIYDYTWYGSFSASEEVFGKMQQDHHQVVKLIGPHEQK